MLAWNVERVAIMSLQRDGGRKLTPLKKLLEEMQQKGGRQSIAEQRAMIASLSKTLNQPLQRMRLDANGKYYAIN